MSEATDEKDLVIAIAVFLEGIHIDKEEKDRSDRVGTYRGTRVVIWVTFLGPDPTRRNVDPTRPAIADKKSDPTRPDPSPMCTFFN